MGKNNITETLIKEEFIRIYAEKPLEKIKVNHFVSACNIARGTFYFYFKDVYDLYKVCESEMIRYLENGLEELSMSTIRGNYKKHAKLYTKYLDRYLQNKEAIKIFMMGSEASSFKDALYCSVVKWYSQIMEFSGDINEKKKEMLVHFYASGWVLMIYKWFQGDCEMSTEVIGDVVAMIQYRGVFLKEEN